MMEPSRDAVKAIKHKDMMTSQKAGPFLDESLGVEISAEIGLVSCMTFPAWTSDIGWVVMECWLWYLP